MTDIATLSIRIESLEAKVASANLDKLSASSSTAESLVKKLAAAWGAFKVAEYAREAATLAARYETLGVTMRVAGLNAGYGAAQMGAFEKALQHTGISMVESRASLTSLATANIDLAKAQQIARASQDLAVVGGINSSEAFARVVQGIKSGEVEVLRTIGLNVQWEDSYRKLAASMGKNVNDLSGQEKLQARVNTVLQQASAYAGIYEASMSTAGKQMLSMQRYTEDLKVKLGAAFGPTLSALVAGATDAIKSMSDALSSAASNGSLGRFADSLGALTSGAIGAIGGTVSLIVSHLKALEVALIAVGVASAYAWGPRGLAALGNLAGPMLSSLVGMVSAVQNFAAGASLASAASSAWAGALAFMSNPITIIIAGVTALTAAFLTYDRVVHGSIDAVEAQGRAMDEHIQKQKGWLSLREDAMRMEMKLKAIQSDGSMNGPATKESRVKELVSQALPSGKNYSSEDIENANRYAAKLINLEDAYGRVRKAIEDKAAAERKAAEQAKAAQKAIKDQTDTLERQWMGQVFGEREVFHYDLTKQGIPADTRGNLMQLWDSIKALKDFKELEKEFRDSLVTLDPVAAETAKMADVTKTLTAAVTSGLIPQERMNELMEAAALKYTIAGQAATKAREEMERHNKKLQEDAARLNLKDDWQTKKDRLDTLASVRDAKGNLILTPDTYQKELQKIMKESDTIWGAMAYGVEQFADRGSEALANFFNGTKTGFREMTASILVEMEKLIIKQQLMQPVMNWAMQGLTTLFNGYNYNALYNSNTADMSNQMGGDSYVPYPVRSDVGGLVKNSTGAIKSEVNVTINNNGTTEVSSTSKAGGADLARLVEAAVIHTIEKEQRPGGSLNRVVR